MEKLDLYIHSFEEALLRNKEEELFVKKINSKKKKKRSKKGSVINYMTESMYHSIQWM